VSYELASVVLPVYRQAEHIEGVLRRHLEHVAPLPIETELVVVVNGPDDGSLAICRGLERKLKGVTVVESDPGWGEAVLTGLAKAQGDLLGFTNSARTSSETLALAMEYAIRNPGVVVKASRKTRDSFRRRLGSLLFNLECRWLFDLPTFDVNGTPKLFPRSCSRLLELTSRNDLLDVEFNAVCFGEGYPLIEVPIEPQARHGGTSTTDYTSALNMYWGAYNLKISQPTSLRRN
jgi:glycosyltransferase involved in cell wall biosynthesis